MSLLDIELLTRREIQGLLGLSNKAVYQLLKRLPPGAVVPGKQYGGRRDLVHAWAIAQILGMEGKCPACGQPIKVKK